MILDVNFDFQAEAGGRDSDKYSPTLQKYHQVLWSKPLPGGDMFQLEKISGNRLHHSSVLGDFTLSSDRAVANFASWKRLAHIIEQVPAKKLNEFVSLTDTIGGIIVWPSNQIDGKPTINAERGFNRKIADRLDLTIECIRRYYLGETSPMYETLLRYKSFFDLFVDFRGYIDFFLLQDAVSDNHMSVNIAAPFDDFQSLPAPKDLTEYLQYIETTVKLVSLRNRRIETVI